MAQGSTLRRARVAAVAAILGLTATAGSASGDVAKAPPVTVLGCAITPQMSNRQASGTEIAYVNTGSNVLHHVTFKVDFHTIDADLSRTVDDTGTFAPGVRIDHHFDSYAGVSYTTYEPECTVTAAS